MSENNLQQHAADIPVIDYEGSGYRTDFWTGQGREYEDATERLALQELIPSSGGRLIEVGAGFGRLADLYRGYEQVILFDYSRTLLQDAAKTLGDDPRFVFVAGNIYRLPFRSGLFDTLVMVRVMHHLADVPQALTQIARVLHDKSTGILEYANKRNLKSILRWAMQQQEWSPFNREPLEFVKLNYDFHPQWMSQRMGEAGLQVKRRFGVSHFRLPFLKERVMPSTLARLDERLFEVGGRFAIAPSVFAQVVLSDEQRVKPFGGAARADLSVAELFRCPLCSQKAFEMVDVDQEELEAVVCCGCKAQYVKNKGVWDFKEPRIL